MDKWLAVLTSIVAGIIYLTGYAYLDGFYGYFNISLNELELGPQSVLVHAAQPFKAFVSDLPIGVSILIIAISFLTLSAIFGVDVIYQYTTQKFEYSKSILRILFLTISMSVSAGAFFSAQGIGLENAKSDYLNLNRMAVLGEPESYDIAGFSERNTKTALFHLLTTRSTFYGVIKFNGEKRRWIIRIPRSDSVAIRVYQDITY